MSKQRKTIRRVELKQEIKHAVKYLHFINILKNSLLFKLQYKQRTINSIYFDTHDFSKYNESISGNKIREKHRLRWYGNKDKLSLITYEIKHKESHLSWKHLIKTNYKINYNSSNWENLFLNNLGLSDLEFTELNFMKPVSMISYKRNYFQSFDKKIRLTIDENIQFSNLINSKKPNLNSNSINIDSIIVELKFEEKYMNDVKSVQNSLNFQPQRFSKYCESIRF